MNKQKKFSFDDHEAISEVSSKSLTSFKSQSLIRLSIYSRLKTLYWNQNIVNLFVSSFERNFWICNQEFFVYVKFDIVKTNCSWNCHTTYLCTTKEIQWLIIFVKTWDRNEPIKIWDRNEPIKSAWTER